MCKAWFKSMTAANIISSFKATGVCPFNRNMDAGEERSPSFEPQSLARKTGLAYIPLYSPAGSRKPAFSTPVLRNPKPITSTPNSLSCSFSDSEVTPSTSLFENSFDCTFVHTAVPLRRATSTSSLLVLPPAPNCIKTKFGKSSGRVLTSRENLMMLAKKEKEAARKREERKNEREEQKIQRELQKMTKSKFNNPRRACTGQIPVCVCPYVTTLVKVSLGTTLRMRYVQHCYRLFLV